MADTQVITCKLCEARLLPEFWSSHVCSKPVEGAGAKTFGQIAYEEMLVRTSHSWGFAITVTLPPHRWEDQEEQLRKDWELTAQAVINAYQARLK